LLVEERKKATAVLQAFLERAALSMNELAAAAQADMILAECSTKKVGGVDAAPPLLLPHLCRRPHWAATRLPRKPATLYLDGRLVGRGEEGSGPGTARP
jgi:hypothetical protein